MSRQPLLQVHLHLCLLRFMESLLTLMLNFLLSIFAGLSHAVMICAERIEWIKNSKSLIATRRTSDGTMIRKNKKRKDEELVEKERTHEGKESSDMGDEKGKEDVVNEKEEEEEMRVSREYDVYYDTFIAAIKGSRLYN